MAFIPPLVAGAGSLLASAGGASAALTAASAGVGALSSIEGGNYQAAVARNNAQIAEQNAANTSLASQKEAMRSDQDYAAFQGEQLAAQGASGFDVLGRSQEAARLLSQRTGRTAALDISQEGTAGARRSLQEAANFRAAGQQAQLQGFVTGAGDLLSGASSLIRGRGARARIPSLRSR